MKSNPHLFRLNAMNTRSTALLASMILLWSQLPSSAITQVRANSTDNIDSSTPEQVASFGSVSDAEDGTFVSGMSNGFASASFGVLRAFGQAATAARTDSFGYSVFSSNTATWRDDFLFSSAALNGTAGSVQVRFTIDGNLAMTPSGVPDGSDFYNFTTYSQIGFTFLTADGQGIGNKWERLYANGTSASNQGLFLGIEQVATLNFIYGTPLTDVRLDLQAVVNATGSNKGWTSSGVANAANTATWGGFGTVLDAGGNPVTNYTFSSGSGTNFAQAIPEPGTVTLVAAAGLLAALARRRRR